MQVTETNLAERFARPGRNRYVLIERSRQVISLYASQKAKQALLPITSRRFSSLLHFSGRLIGLFSQAQWPELHQMRNVALAVE